MYRQLSDFAPDIQNDYSADPLFYCSTDTMDSQFLHGSQGRINGRYSLHCSQFLAARCAENWDQVCEAMSKDSETRYPSLATSLTLYGKDQCGLTYGEALVRDSAYKKYKVQSVNCNLMCEPFDPTVANSPLVCFEQKTACSGGPTSGDFCSGDVEGGQCFSMFMISKEQAKVLDNDPIMNKILAKPKIASELLEKIYNTMSDNGTLYLLRGTKLALYYNYLGHPV